jgi:hypothetical protein
MYLPENFQHPLFSIVAPIAYLSKADGQVTWSRSIRAKHSRHCPASDKPPCPGNNAHHPNQYG